MKKRHHMFYIIIQLPFTTFCSYLLFDTWYVRIDIAIYIKSTQKLHAKSPVVVK